MMNRTGRQYQFLQKETGSRTVWRPTSDQDPMILDSLLSNLDIHFV